jgi:hypothetical protein
MLSSADCRPFCKISKWLIVYRFQEQEGPGLTRRLISWLPVILIMVVLFFLVKVYCRIRKN